VSRRARMWLLIPALAAFAGLLVWGMTGLPDSGSKQGAVAHTIARVAVPERKATNVVTSITLDYRGFDTLGEEMILFTAALGLVMLLREQRDEHVEERSDDEESEDRKPPPTSDALRVLALVLVGPTVLVGLYIVAHGALTPGGGFQGGVILATSLLLVYLAGKYLVMRDLTPIPALEVGEATGAAGFALIGLGGLIASAVFLDNFIPLGTAGSILSGGTIPFLYIAIGLEVAGAFMLAFLEFLDQTLRVRGGARSRSRA
jgi:multicomponent Na+:H+ antiporter subunit B